MLIPVQEMNALGELISTTYYDVSILVYVAGLAIFIMAIKLFRK